MTATVAHYIDTAEFGGAERSLLHLIGALDGERYRSVLLHPDVPGLSPLITGARAAGIATRVVPHARGPRGAVHIPGIGRVLADEEASVLHAHLNWPLACTAAIFAAAWRRVPAIVATVQLFGRLPTAHTLGLQARLVTRQVDRYLPVSHGVARRLQAELAVEPSRIDVVHNGIPDARRAASDPGVRSEMCNGRNGPVVLTLARLQPQKGLSTLLRAAVALPEVAIAIAGEGPQRQELQAEAGELGIEDRVVFLGFREDTAALLASADVFVLPSEHEGLPLALLEAMAAGRPVVATAIPGIDEVVTAGETGLLFPAGDSPSLTASIRRLLDDPRLAERLAAAGEAHVRAHFTSSRMAERVMRSYDELLNGGGGGRRPRSRRQQRSGLAFGDLQRTTPFSREFGFDRGKPVDRRYIEDFLASNAADIHGRVLEVKDDAYTRIYGRDRVTARDVLDIDAANTDATLIDDLATGTRLPSDAFDCIVLTQTLHLIFDLEAAVRTVHRILKPGGVLLATVPGITQIPRAEADSWYWSLSEKAVRRLLTGAFSADAIRIRCYGNVLAATAFLYGIAEEELQAEDLDRVDPDYPVILAVRAVKGAAGS
jgi:glycosyltransferase involved in cell wall biosynthesis/SAM-dependent methyltransferase